ncbi:UvrD-helicase domain-containing protein [Flavobacterium sp.]|uniref:UvrD-helicase domain-containing protein n=1 Tax=Flavobacterium sp. TaxID=239 RepID=UPI0012217C9A|nr:UvrD-helicase domain-containing protein [Flavobacterium sp.]RZJ69483.1 MAG: hypothetical protein EOO49_17390 [Flavobacterium sp.]
MADAAQRRKLRQEMALKKQNHKDNNTKLLETYSYYNRDNALLPKLEKMLKDEAVVFKPRDTKTIYDKITKNDKKFGSELIKLIESFINLGKSRRMDTNSLKHLLSKNPNSKSDFMLERQKIFLQFALPILDKYDRVLKERNEIDFNDMINRAADEIQNQKPNYKYIIIDEYQDISFSRFNLIKAIRELSGAKLIAVGDDWQSIYRFAGSDVSLLRNFEKHVGKHEKLLIEQTYRNSQQLIDITSRFILKNKSQLPKSPTSKKEMLQNPIKLVGYEPNTIEQTFLNQIRQLVEKYGNKPILVLGRHSFDIDDLIKVTQNNSVKYIERSNKLQVKGFEDVDIKFLTIHKSKGLEADNVIILNLKNHLLGFPNKMTDDPILSLLLNDDEEYRFAEERRLFYVALTRTKNEVLLFVPSDISIFASELISDINYLTTIENGTLTSANCPYCQTGKLVIRTNPIQAKQFLGCTHYPICNETYNDIKILDNALLCKSCQSGFMVSRSGRFGEFLGCTNYPKCTETIKLS